MSSISRALFSAFLSSSCDCYVVFATLIVFVAIVVVVFVVAVREFARTFSNNAFNWFLSFMSKELKREDRPLRLSRRLSVKTFLPWSVRCTVTTLSSILLRTLFTRPARSKRLTEIVMGLDVVPALYAMSLTRCGPVSNKNRSIPYCSVVSLLSSFRFLSVSTIPIFQIARMEVTICSVNAVSSGVLLDKVPLAVISGDKNIESPFSFRH